MSRTKQAGPGHPPPSPSSDCSPQPVCCFAAGTRIGTICGLVAVEHLRPGVLLPTQFAQVPQPILWIGTRRVDCRRHPDPSSVLPVKITADAFGPRLPKRDLLLSPDHAIYTHGALIPVKHLITNAAVVQIDVDTVSYYHLELPRHDVILAEGLLAESYLDLGNRNNFSNGGRSLRLYPQFGPPSTMAALQSEALTRVPQVVSGRPVEDALRVLNRRGAPTRAIND
jgi:collagen type I alpha